MEKSVGPFRADILCKDTGTDKHVIIENQFGKTDHTHLGQIMTYASGLDAFTVIWIAENFTEEHRAALDWLNNITDQNIEFFGIEIELFKTGESSPAPMFNMVSKPNTWSKSIKKSSSNIQLTDTKIFHEQYWQAMKDYVETQTVSFRMQKALPQHWTNISIGKSNYKLCAIANSRDKWILFDPLLISVLKPVFCQTIQQQRCLNHHLRQNQLAIQTWLQHCYQQESFASYCCHC